MAKAAYKCTICGKAAATGELLCPPCRAALKRASHVTVQELPHYRAPVRRSRKVRPEVAHDVVPTPPPRVPAARAMRVALVVGGVVLAAGTAWLMRNQAAAPAVAAVAAPVPALRANATHAAGPGNTAGTPPADIPATPQPAALAPAVPLPERAAAARNAAAARARAEALRAELNVPAAPQAMSEAPSAPPEPASAPVPVPRAPPAPDRWQQMGDALAQCDREGGFTGFICDQRVRLRSCEGYWGRVPQCPEPPENPR